MGTESEVNAAQAPVGTRDEAIAIVGEEQHSIDPIVAARAVRKIDLFLIPAMIIGCTFRLILISSSNMYRWPRILRQSYSRFSSSLRHDDGFTPHHC